VQLGERYSQIPITAWTVNHARVVKVYRGPYSQFPHNFRLSIAELRYFGVSWLFFRLFCLINTITYLFIYLLTYLLTYWWVLQFYSLQYWCYWWVYDTCKLTLLSRVSILTRDTDTAILSVRLSVCPSVRPSVRDVPVLDENGLTYRHSFF